MVAVGLESCWREHCAVRVEVGIGHPFGAVYHTCFSLGVDGDDSQWDVNLASNETQGFLDRHLWP